MALPPAGLVGQDIEQKDVALVTAQEGEPHMLLPLREQYDAEGRVEGAEGLPANTQIYMSKKKLFKKIKKDLISGKFHWVQTFSTSIG